MPLNPVFPDLPTRNSPVLLHPLQGANQVRESHLSPTPGKRSSVVHSNGIPDPPSRLMTSEADHVRNSTCPPPRSVPTSLPSPSSPGTHWSLSQKATYEAF
ncbi:hypothetical protein TNCV_4846191 [Trichonephila clavipes]|uniref:Uncharacterized protein n=1 Tax=Trichonephila clavipes TaxID=2585209 RepID=A0A8X6WJF1_TRICX|nr:hypothetical protein TNCV_4846191 [Trichonephila clavipes]